MGVFTKRFGLVEPVLLACQDGRWLAVSETTAPLRVGVLADTEAAALEAFEREVRAWAALWDEPAGERR